MMVRSGNASANAREQRSASDFWPSASSRAIGPVVPPVSRNSPAAWARITSSGTLGFNDGSVSRKPMDDRRCRFASPVGVAREQHQRIGREPEVVGSRASAIWQPMMGWTPLATQAWENSSAPNRLPGVGDRDRGHGGALGQGGDFSTLIAPSLSEKAEWTRRWTKSAWGMHTTT
jgi:hypothetical protein